MKKIFTSKTIIVVSFIVSPVFSFGQNIWLFDKKDTTKTEATPVQVQPTVTEPPAEQPSTPTIEQPTAKEEPAVNDVSITELKKQKEEAEKALKEAKAKEKKEQQARMKAAKEEAARVKAEKAKAAEAQAAEVKAKAAEEKAKAEEQKQERLRTEQNNVSATSTNNTGAFQSSLPTIGVGLHVERQGADNDVKFSALSAYPTNDVVLTIHLIDKIRIEPEFGFYKQKDKEENISGDNVYLQTNSTSFKIGAYRMIQFSKVIASIGAKFVSQSVSAEQLSYIENFTYTQSTKSTGFGPSLQAEYLFGDHFSIGGSVSMIFAKDKFNPGDGIAAKRELSNSYTSTGLLVRIYF